MSSNYNSAYPVDEEYIKNLPAVIRTISKQMINDQIVNAGLLNGINSDGFSKSDHVHNYTLDQYIAGEVIPAYSLLYVKYSNTVGLADAMNLDQAERIIGISINQAIPGNTVNVITFGLVTNPEWNLIPGDPYYLGSFGNIVPVPLTNGFDQKIGIAKTDTILSIQIGTTQTSIGGSNTVINIDGGEF